MAVKRHFTGKPVGEEYDESSSEEEVEEVVGEEPVQHQQKNIKTSINIRPIEKEVPRETKSVENVNVGEDNSIRESAGIEKKQESEESSEESDEESESDSDSDSDSSDDEPKLLKPVFISKSKRSQAIKQTSNQDKSTKDNERTLKTIEAHINQDIEQRKKEKESEINLGGIDDTDDLDPELERKQWELRQLTREERDRAKLEKEQDEYEELENRRLRTEEERLKEYEENKKEQEQRGKEDKQKVKGAFFRDEALLKRDLGEENEKYDKTLLPQKYDPKAHK
ncbi:hypothetical protein BN7_2287 [Wickerhamomyces ciferrii]|uniref:Micro-fibrillar-associated protein 1 C-terminal domain-containing protein n=1 Tax=Wickerhamomyces ciferrii (strain ATCC 14091 / BCRC 22168 / CBS 111 / JCM 3599 / NBRC 0793 / NRRL Y-1031 F-60-10) TaxID=1206466 RepID=K0KNQ2_WICCF|nr:uncharacterized protein BN7_2287 [Wickerhamomyces ciferrii]CCH42743.1 hypothetical protein BN7_2287 [Wickerhamomyces ciferrii]